MSLSNAVLKAQVHNRHLKNCHGVLTTKFLNASESFSISYCFNSMFSSIMPLCAFKQICSHIRKKAKFDPSVIGFQLLCKVPGLNFQNFKFII